MNAQPSFSKPIPQQHLWRALASHALARSRISGDAHKIASDLFPDDAPTQALLTRAAVGPATTTTAGWADAIAATAVADAIMNLAPQSAAAALMARGVRVSLAGVAQVDVPRWATALPAPAFVTEGAPIPVVQGVLGTTSLTPFKMAFMTALTSETIRGSNAETIVRLAMADALTGGLDAAIFSSTAAGATRPAGIFNGVTPITATAGGGLDAMVTDLQNLIAAIVTAGGGGNVAFVANPLQAASVALRVTNPAFPVFSSRAMPAGSVAAVELGGFASALGDEPRIESSTEAAVHFEDTTPLAIGTAGSPNTVAAPVRSAFQTDCVVLRLIQPISWAMRGSGLVQLVEEVTW